MPKKRGHTITELLVMAREQAGLTQKQVAESGLISQSQLSKLENGQRKLDFLVLIELAKLYQKELEFFKPK